MRALARLNRPLRYLIPLAAGLGVLGLAASGSSLRMLGFIAEPAKSLPLVSLLSPISPVTNGSLQRSLQTYGYIPGQNIRLEFKFANRHEELLDSLAQEIVADNPRVIVAVNPTAAAAAQRATKTIPIVFLGLGDPVAMGLAATLARPGGNITGITNMPSDLNAKNMEMLKDLLPDLGRIALVARKGNVNHQLHVGQEVAAARLLGLEAKVYNIEGPEAFEAATDEIAAAGIRAVVIMPDSTYTTHEPAMMKAALGHRLAVIANSRDFARAGAIMSLGPDYHTLYETMFDPAARYIDLILRGADPAELPVDQPMNVTLTVNRKIARMLEIELPRSLLLRANALID
jgi:putative ABC transport system substrate-binding protein